MNDDPRLAELETAAQRVQEVVPGALGEHLAGLLRNVAWDIKKNGFCTAEIGMCISLAAIVRDLTGKGEAA